MTLQESNLKLVSSHLEFVSRITQNLKQVADPAGLQPKQIDSSKLRRFEEALLPPPPLLAIEAKPTPASLPWLEREQRQIGYQTNEMVSPTSTKPLAQKLDPLAPDERMISERLENLFKRSGVPTIDSGQNSAHVDISSTVQQILERLWETRTKIGEAVGLPTGAITQAHVISMIDNPQRALLEELGVWNQFEERVQYEVHRRENLLAQAATHPARTPTAASLPIPIRHRRRSSGRISPSTSFPLDSPPSDNSLGSADSVFRHTRGSSISTMSGSIRLDKSLPVFL
jgi:hypothetical protein